MCGLVEQTLVAEVLQAAPGRHTDSVLRRQQVVVPRYQSNRMVIGGKSNQSLSSCLLARSRSRSISGPVVSSRPRNVSPNIPGSSCYEVPALFQDPYWNAPTTQAPHYTQASIIRCHN